MAEKKKDELSGVETTGHEWDGIEELNNPMPSWWVTIFIICIIFAVGYWVVYPSWPSGNKDARGGTEGSFGWSSTKRLEERRAQIMERRAKYMKRFENASFDEIMKDEELMQFAIAGGASAFKDNCATCHGTGAQGGPGFPNLNDDDWIWGGTIDDIYQTLLYGIRSGHDEARESQMPAFGRDELLEEEDIKHLIAFIPTLANGKGGDAAHPGASIFDENCASCHGTNGQGGREFGAPNLSDAIWLYGGDEKSLHETIYNARAGVMPTWAERLPEHTIRQLAIYVHSLGGGE